MKSSSSVGHWRTYNHYPQKKIGKKATNIGVKDESNQSDKRVFSDRGREGLFL
ncbi:MAG: hypothetical protein BAJALOKI3v1_50118 [Promethearchaeota archaeon]|nr:MAG: hypothetical protein BAJALOKI3v1_50118 [Candidatus Lokiarchaeota archaeon]